MGNFQTINECKIAELCIASSKAHELVGMFRSCRLDWYERYKLNINICRKGLKECLLDKTNRTLVVFDLDSTLIDIECIDELARLAGKYEKVAAITKAAMEGKIDFCESLCKRAALLKDLDATTSYEQLIKSMNITPGAAELINALKAYPVTMAIISGGFMTIANHVKDLLGLDYAFANDLEVDNNTGCFTGITLGPIIDAKGKEKRVSSLAKELGIPQGRIIALGDGANDLLMLKAASPYGCAFNAKKSLSEQADISVYSADMSKVLIALGIAEL